MTIKESNKHKKSKVIATDIDTNVLDYASKGIYKFSKISNNFPNWIDISKYFKRKVGENFDNDDILVKVNDDIKKMLIFSKMNLNDSSYPFKNKEFDVIFCRNVLIYFSKDDQNNILKKLFRHLKIGGTLYLGHSESPHDLELYTNKLGQNIFIKIKDI
jgi:chemotaxis protein methyltransferase CheR